MSRRWLKKNKKDEDQGDLSKLNERENEIELTSN